MTNPVGITVCDAAEPIRVELEGPAPFGVEYDAALIVLHLHAETEGRFSAAGISLRHAIDDPAAFARVAGCPVAHNAAWSGIAVSTAAWQLPMRRRERGAVPSRIQALVRLHTGGVSKDAGLRETVRVSTYASHETLGRAAARTAAQAIRAAVAAQGSARIVAATGASQFAFLDALTTMPDVPWPHVELFHLDEYVGLPIDHPASFRRYLLERVIARTGIPRYHLLDGEHDAAHAAARVGRLLAERPPDVAFVGIGENGHLAFNDPPADFSTEEPYVIVTLDEPCRRQQVGEGWFATLADVPTHAISMSIRQILKSREIIAVVPEGRKATAVAGCLEGEVMPMAPASVLRTHPATTVYLDRDSAARLSPATRGRILEDDAE